jgi:hypothetical protein
MRALLSRAKLMLTKRALLELTVEMSLSTGAQVNRCKRIFYITCTVNSPQIGHRPDPGKPVILKDLSDLRVSVDCQLQYAIRLLLRPDEISKVGKAVTRTLLVATR